MNMTDTAGDLQRALGLVTRRLRQHRPLGEVGQTESGVLASLVRQDHLTQAELARTEAVSPQTMSTTIAALLRRGYVDRTSDPDDGRRVRISITPAGRAFARRKRTARHDQIQRALADFSEAELRILRDAAPLLERFADRLT